MRLSRGRSTPTRRATVVCILLLGGGLFPVRSRIACRGPASDRTSMSGLSAHWCWEVCIKLSRYCCRAGADQPCRCLWRGSEQITMTRPCRRITLHLSQIGLTLGFTFTAVSVLFYLWGSLNVVALLVPVHDAAPGQVVGRQLHYHAVLGQ